MFETESETREHVELILFDLRLMYFRLVFECSMSSRKSISEMKYPYGISPTRLQCWRSNEFVLMVDLPMFLFTDGRFTDDADLASVWQMIVEHP